MSGAEASAAGDRGQATGERDTQSAPVLLALVPGLISQSAQHEARLSALERATSDHAARTEGRMSALGQQVQHLDDRLSAQDAESARQWQQIRSQLGTLGQQQQALIAAEGARTEAARRAAEEAAERHKDTVARIHRIVGGVVLFVASCTWPLLAGLSVPRRLLALGIGCAFALIYSALVYYRSRSEGRTS